MKLKSKLILSTLALTMFFGVESAFSQGFFKNDDNPSSNGSTTTDGGRLRIGPPSNEEFPGGTSASPIGEGLAILSLLSGGYFMLKKRNSRK